MLLEELTDLLDLLLQLVRQLIALSVKDLDAVVDEDGAEDIQQPLEGRDQLQAEEDEDESPAGSGLLPGDRL